MYIISHRNTFFVISGLLVVVSLLSIFVWGLQFGIDFTGGSLVEVEFSSSLPTREAIQDTLETFSFGDVRMQLVGERGLILRMRTLSDDEHTNLLKTLSETYPGVIEKRFSSIGPIVGGELARKSFVALSIAVAVIILYIAYAFRGVSHPVKSWKYGVVAILALIHDITIPAGLFAFLGKVYGVEIDALFITAVLAVLGLSVNDTIVVFDRIRENLKNHISKDFAETVGISLRQTFVRSLNTSITTLLTLSALIFFGPESTRYFTIALAAGLIVGTYSSIFIASPLLVVLERRGRRA